MAKFAQKVTKLNIFLYKKSQFTTTELFTSQQKFDILKGKLIRDRISCDWMMIKFKLLNQIFKFKVQHLYNFSSKKLELSSWILMISILPLDLQWNIVMSLYCILKSSFFKLSERDFYTFLNILPFYSMSNI